MGCTLSADSDKKYLSRAVCTGNAVHVKAFLQAPGSERHINLPWNEQIGGTMTLLHVGAYYPQVLEILLQKGGDPTIVDQYGYTAVDYSGTNPQCLAIMQNHFASHKMVMPAPKPVGALRAMQVQPIAIPAAVLPAYDAGNPSSNSLSTYRPTE